MSMMSICFKRYINVVNIIQTKNLEQFLTQNKHMFVFVNIFWA